MLSNEKTFDLGLVEAKIHTKHFFTNSILVESSVYPLFCAQLNL